MMDSTWKCPVCDFTTDSETEKDKHQRDMTDAAHQKIVGMKVEETAHAAADGVKDALRNVQDTVSEIADDAKKHL